MKKYLGFHLTLNKMEKPLASIFLVSLLISCSQSNEYQKREISYGENLNRFASPSEFIGDYKSKAMILGVFHFSNPGHDTYKEKYTVDILSEKRQNEIDELIQKLQEFNPTKILIEAPRIKYDSIYNLRYQDYLKGTFDISDKTDERYQVGFKLAKILGHDRIYASDAESTAWFGADIDWDNYDEEAYLKSLGQFDKASRYDFDQFYELGDSLKSVQSLTNHFITINDPNDRLKDHQAYLTNIIGGAGDLYIGADAVARWYQRNLRIFANTYDLADFSKEERLLLIYGSGHVWQLRQLLTDSPDFEYVEVNDYLK